MGAGGTDAVKLLTDLIGIASVNPRDGRRPAEAAVARYVVDWARRLGLPARLCEVVDGRPNAVVRLPGRDPGHAVLLETHMDTVELPPGAEEQALSGRVENGRVHGRGACDAKGSLAAYMAALAEVAADADRPEVILAAVVDEEYHYRGVTHLLESDIDPGSLVGAVVGEPTGLRAVAAHSGVMRCRLEASAPGGHSSQGHTAENAVVAVARAVLALQDQADALIRPSGHRLIPRGSLAVTVMAGGAGENSLPERCVAVVDRRLAPGEDAETSWTELRDCLAVACPDVRVARPHTVDLALDTDADSPFARRFAATLRRQGLAAEPVGAGWGSDASKIAAYGVPALVWGPGRITEAHAEDEFVDIAQLASAKETLTAFLRDLPAGFDGSA